MVYWTTTHMMCVVLAFQDLEGSWLIGQLCCPCCLFETQTFVQMVFKHVSLLFYFRLGLRSFVWLNVVTIAIKLTFIILQGSIIYKFTKIILKFLILSVVLALSSVREITRIITF
jgi:hypothetical protein